MCNESLKTSPLPIGEVNQRSVQTLAVSRCQRREAKSVIVKMMRLVKRMINAHGKERSGGGRGGGGGGRGRRQSKSVRILREEIGAVETERENARNDEESNNSVITAKMTYTIEELKEIVDDNLANELRAARIITEE